MKKAFNIARKPVLTRGEDTAAAVGPLIAIIVVEDGLFLSIVFTNEEEEGNDEEDGTGCGEELRELEQVLEGDRTSRLRSGLSFLCDCTPICRLT